MSDTNEERLRLLELSDVKLEGRITSLETMAVREKQVRSLIDPVMAKQDAHDRRLDKLTDIVERQAQTMEKQSNKIEMILEDFHNSLLEDARSRQLITQLQKNAPVIMVTIAMCGVIYAIVYFILAAQGKIPIPGGG